MATRLRSTLALGAGLLGCTVHGPFEEGRDFVPPEGLDTVKQAVWDCTERTDTGYVQGDPFDITVVMVDGEPVERETANAYIVMQEAAARDGVNIRINSGFRTMDEQTYFWNCYQNCNCNSCNLAARPGFSNHQSGHALDLNTAAGGVLNWLNNHGGDYGFSRTVPSENWHWEWWGGGPGGGPCQAQPCDALPAEGGVIDDDGPCFHPYGPSNYWRVVDGEGHGGRLHWTNAFVSGEPDNWARWDVNLAAAGEYEVEVSSGGPYGLWNRTRYRVRHAGVEEDVVLDLSAADGWQSLGVFAFAAGEDQAVEVFDNYEGDVPPEQHILADAVRLRPYVAPPPPVTEPDASLPETPDAGEGDTPDAEPKVPDPEGDAAPVPDAETPEPEPPTAEEPEGFDDDDASVAPDDEPLPDAGEITPRARLGAQARGVRYEGGCATAPGAPAGLGWLVVLGLLRRRRRPA